MTGRVLAGVPSPVNEGKKRVFMVQDGDYQGGGNKPEEGVKKRQMHCLFFRIFFVGV